MINLVEREELKRRDRDAYDSVHDVRKATRLAIDNILSLGEEFDEAIELSYLNYDLLKDNLGRSSILTQWDFNRESLSFTCKNIINRLTDNLKLESWRDEILNYETTHKETSALLHVLLDKYAAAIYDDYVILDNSELANYILDRFIEIRNSEMKSLESLSGLKKTLSTSSEKAKGLDELCKSFITPENFKSGFYPYKNTIFRIRRIAKGKVEITMLTERGSGGMVFTKAPSSQYRKLIYINPMSEQEVLRLCEEHQFCAICGRPIEVIESVRRGIGPVCAERLEKMDIDTKGSKKENAEW